MLAHTGNLRTARLAERASFTRRANVNSFLRAILKLKAAAIERADAALSLAEALSAFKRLALRRLRDVTAFRALSLAEAGGAFGSGNGESALAASARSSRRQRTAFARWRSVAPTLHIRCALAAAAQRAGRAGSLEIVLSRLAASSAHGLSHGIPMQRAVRAHARKTRQAGWRVFKKAIARSLATQVFSNFYS
ncbi:hypothetical protein T492DRAFT_479724 [Pavlovales sp. CCMP2436]|nr:hypothetical protein T492DRAFT_479724 [Pavlovales sp. CCMP2436]